jgi:hypothetical protein
LERLEAPPEQSSVEVPSALRALAGSSNQTIRLAVGLIVLLIGGLLAPVSVTDGRLPGRVVRGHRAGGGSAGFSFCDGLKKVGGITWVRVSVITTTPGASLLARAQRRR